MRQSCRQVYRGENSTPSELIKNVWGGMKEGEGGILTKAETWKDKNGSERFLHGVIFQKKKCVRKLTEGFPTLFFRGGDFHPDKPADKNVS